MQAVNDNLNKNLDAIKRYNSFLAGKILQHTQAQGNTQFVQSKSGDVNLLYNDILVHDENSPIDEAIQLLNGLKRNDSRDVTVIYGLGLGYVLKRFVENYKGNIIIVESNLDILRITFEAVDFSQELQNPGILITNFLEDITRHLKRFYVPEARVHFVAMNSYKLLFPDFYKAVLNEVEYDMPEEYTGGNLKINLGAGKWKKQGWKTLDCYRFASINMDLRSTDPIPLEDNVITKAFCSHCIEHIEDYHLENLLKELYRCMESGAIFRVSCPDAMLAIDAFTSDNTEWFNWVKKNNIGSMLINTFVSYESGSGGPQVPDLTVKEKLETLDTEDFIDWCVSLKDKNRSYIAHTNGYNYEKLSRKLAEAGFIDIIRSSYKQSSDSELIEPEFDLHPTISLYVECFKP